MSSQYRIDRYAQMSDEELRKACYFAYEQTLIHREWFHQDCWFDCWQACQATGRKHVMEEEMARVKADRREKRQHNAKGAQ